MTKFIFLCEEHGITIQTDTYCHFFDNAKNAAEAAFELLQGGDTTDWDNNEPDQRTEVYTGDQNDLLEIAKSFKYIKDQYANLEAVFYEEVHLAFYIRGLING
jgi:hypothetical protein